ncbi:efflux RND transporter periplasmic adaptor subunit [Alkalilimnicola sp. S0819]|uniref:efflux RND transporter periplasmic adaptor subunit n=1 Tax=Alkalilimnicola sp. S0819 TaxID=2613922 RepID=UPI001261D519|nr:efflux RND transporter periplasmic adaptor subunit [Alkalilimnicola sp. S0819]KAB7624375.1 efflux RND transporter periplasmic adaptor subunit [Alkalilimnicola sp. S0819]MPQ16201.1 efflux RND transporter periplasmic adaptor subunit [Alkalilimnicola sp. S0819]
MRVALKRWFYLLLALGVLVLLVLGLRPAPLQVDVQPVVEAPLMQSVRAEGRTRVLDHYEITAPISGELARLELDVGDPVSRGQALLRIRPLPAPALDARRMAEQQARVRAAQSALAAAEQEVAAAQAQAERAAQALARAEAMRQEGYLSEQELEAARAEARAGAARLASARFRGRTAGHELEAARSTLAYLGGERSALEGIALNSPVDAHVLARPQESERVVQAGELLLTLGDTRRLEAVVDVLSADAVRLAPGMRVLLEHTGLARTLDGQVRRIEPVAFTEVSALGVEEQRVNVIVALDSPPEQWQRLGHGYRVDARFVLWESERTLQLPESAVFSVDGESAVFVLEEGGAVLRRVGLGRRGGLQVQVLEGLRAGERVVIYPPRELQAGARIRAR